MNAPAATVAVSPTQLFGLITLALLAALGVFWQTSLSMAEIWWRSETFAHGFFILPISLWLIWQRREELADLSLTPDYRAIAPLLGLGMLWWLANVVDVLVIQQLAVVAMLPVLLWLLFGWALVRALAFPLGFLIFAVPMGEGLIPPLMDFTAVFTVEMLQLSGIPVFKEGLYFEIPGSRWSVVEGCSGVRYLIASVTLGSFYAYITYRSLARRLLFILASIAVPIIANGMRAYMIVMIAHLSDHKLAHGVDHFIYGWVFFGIVMLLLFWLGSYFREDAPQRDGAAGGARPRPLHVAPLARVAAVALAVLLVWPLAAQMNQQREADIAVALNAPEARGGWQPAAEPLSQWRPRYLGPDAELEQSYVNRDGRRVSLTLVYYQQQRQGAELINSQNVMVPQKGSEWSQVGNRSVRLAVDGAEVPVAQIKLRSRWQNLQLYHWNWFGGEYAANSYIAKFIEAKNTLLGRPTAAAAVIVAAGFDSDAGEAEALIEAFIGDMYPAIEASLHGADARGAGR